MKTNISTIVYVAILIGMTIFQSCSNETPFELSGDATLRLDTQLRSDITVTTRENNSITGYTEDYLNENLVIYIENSKGVIRKYIGKNSIPEVITLPVGTYTIEGWTGDSVSASFDKKFFRGFKSDVKIGEGNNSMSLKLDIANVIVEIDKSSTELIKNLKVTFNHSRGDKLKFTENEISEGKRGYFMMPNSDRNIQYKIEGENEEGEPFEKEGEIENVERAHLYYFTFTSDPVVNTTGGGLINLEIKDIPIIEESFEILPAPSFKLKVGDVDSDFGEQLVSTNNPKTFNNALIRVLAYESLEELSLNFSGNFTNVSDISGKNLLDLITAQSLAWSSNNISLQLIETYDKSSIKGKEDVKVIEAWLNFSSEFLNSLSESEDEYTIDITAKDGREYINKVTLKIANTESAVFHQDPVNSGDISVQESNYTAVLTTSAEITVDLYDDSVEDYGIMYRIKDSGNSFQKVSGKTSSATLTRASSNKKFTVKLDNLTSGKTYEYKAYAGEFEEPDEAIKTFTTEEVYSIPNGNMEQWSLDTGSKKDNAYLPSGDGTVTFWDSGNHGSILMSKNITTPDKTFINGNTVAKLKSEKIVGVLAAGNMFAGTFRETHLPSGAELNFGREYNGSHPSALKVKVNYQPGTVDAFKTLPSDADLVNKGSDHGQIFVALASSVSELNTAKGIMFNKDADNILAYGQITWKERVGENNQLVDIKIPLEYREKAKNTKATHIIIVCSASKYGDYFSGSSNSVMYLDDFELEYGDIQWAE